MTTLQDSLDTYMPIDTLSVFYDQPNVNMYHLLVTEGEKTCELSANPVKFDFIPEEKIHFKTRDGKLMTLTYADEDAECDLNMKLGKKETSVCVTIVGIDGQVTSEDEDGEKEDIKRSEAIPDDVQNLKNVKEAKELAKSKKGDKDFLSQVFLSSVTRGKLAICKWAHTQAEKKDELHSGYVQMALEQVKNKKIKEYLDSCAPRCKHRIYDADLDVEYSFESDEEDKLVAFYDKIGCEGGLTSVKDAKKFMKTPEAESNMERYLSEVQLTGASWKRLTRVIRWAHAEAKTQDIVISDDYIGAAFEHAEVRGLKQATKCLKELYPKFEDE